MPLWVSLPISIAFVVGIMIASLLWRREVRRREAMERAQAAGGIPFVKVASAFSDADKTLYPIITWAIAKEGQVLSKVNLGELVALGKNVDRREFHMRLVKSRTVDFVICQNETFSPALAILVGNPSLRGNDRAEDQALAAQVLATAGLPVLWLSPRQSYMPHEVKAMIKEAIRGSGIPSLSTGEAAAGAGDAAASGAPAAPSGEAKAAPNG